MLANPYTFPENSEVKKQLQIAFGKDVTELPAGAIAHAMQMQKAILKADTQAYLAVMKHAIGEKMNLGFTDNDGNEIEISKTPVIKVYTGAPALSRSEDQISTDREQAALPEISEPEK